MLETEESENLRLAYRQSVAAEWLAAAGEVAEASGVELAREAAAYLYRRAGLGVLEANRLRWFYRSGGELTADDHFFITPVLATDDNHIARNRTDSGAFVNEYDCLARASFNQSSRAMCFNDNLDASRVGKGLIFLHEAVHIITELEGLVNRSFYPDQLWLEEAEAYQFECQVLAGLAGWAYSALVERVRDGIEDDGRSLTCAYELSTADFDIFRQIFGQQATEAELEVWADKAVLNGWLEYFKRYRAESLAAFARFLKWDRGPGVDEPAG